MKTYSKILLLLALCLVATSASARKKPRQVVSNDTVYVILPACSARYCQYGLYRRHDTMAVG